MSDYIVSARKYRPSTFHSVVGQDHISQTLKNAIVNDKVAQAYLFTGPRGVGKTTCARIMAKSLNCLNLQDDGEPCNNCESCNNFNEQRSMNIYELDAASNNSVEDIRALVDQVRFAPQGGKYKVYIIDEVHMLSQSAFNAFLKTLEEPPPYAIFILATTEKHKIIPTILSRCQIFDFNRIQIKDILKHLQYISEKEEIESEETALHIIAQKADGALRDALSIFDRIVSFTGSKVTYQFVIENLNIIDYDYYFKMSNHVFNKDISNTLLLFNEIINLGFDGQNLLQGMSEHYRNLLVAKTPNTIELLEIPAEVKKRYLEQAKITDLSFILTALNILNQFNISYKESKNQRLHTELALIKLCHIKDAIQLATGIPDQKKKVSVEEKVKIEAEEKSKTEEKIEEKEELKERQIEEVESESPLKQSEATPEISFTIPQEEKVSKVEETKPENGSKLGSLSQLREKLAKQNSIQAEEAKAEDETEPKETEFSQQEISKFLEAFKSYRETVLKGDKLNLYNALKKHEPEHLEKNKFKLFFENAALEAMFTQDRQNLTNFLLEKYQIHSILIETEIKPLSEEEKSKYLVNPRDKYDYLKSKNPEIEKLQQALGLQPEE